MESPIILVIDDDSYIRQSLGIILRAENYEVVEAEDGKSALSEMEKRLPDLIVQDLHLPDIDRFELNRQLLSFNPEIPILALTGVKLELSEDESYRGFLSILLKPVEPIKFLQTIKSNLPGGRIIRSNADHYQV